MLLRLNSELKLFKNIRLYSGKDILRYLLLIVLFTYIAIESTGEGDFHIYCSASAKVFGNESIYQMPFGDGFHYLYSLFFALCLYPFTFLPFYISKFLWLVLNAALLYRSLKIVFSFFETETRLSNWFYILVVLFSFRFIHENFHSAQITIVILYLCLESIDLIFNKNKPLPGAALLALGINIKLMPLVLLPYLLYRRKFKETAYVIGACIILWTIPVIFLGFDKTLSWTSDWWMLMNPNSQKNVLDVEETSFHSLTTLFATLFIADPGDIHALSYKRNIMHLNFEQLFWVLNIARLLLAALTLYFLSTLPFKNVKSKKRQLYELSYILALVPLLFPHQQHYAFLFFMPAVTVILYYVFSNYASFNKVRKRVLIVLLSVIFLAFNLKVLLGEFNPIYEHYKILTYGGLLVVFLLFYKPIKASFT
jgi:hypothetical protein